MTIELTLISMLTCTICLAIIFKKRDVSPIWAFIPIANMTKFGKLVDSKKLGIATGIFKFLSRLIYIFVLGFEIYLMTEYAETATVPADALLDSTVEVAVPTTIAYTLIVARYAQIIITAVSIILFSILAWKFTIQHDRNPWWIMLWATASVIPYIVFAASSTVVIDGKQYTTTRVETKSTNKSIKTKEKKNKKDKKTLKKEV